MTAKVKEPNEQGESAEASQVKPECFVIMPIADRDGYEAGHFKRVYDWVIKPACEAAGYRPVRADDVSSSHLIVADILKRIVEAPMAICDVSGLNANVMFELGIRQAFGKPVALIKDERTKSVFDISGLRYTGYESSLRADLVTANSRQLATMIKETGDADSGMTSLMSLVDIDAALMPQSTQVSDDSKLILQEIHKLSERVNSMGGSPEISEKGIPLKNLKAARTVAREAAISYEAQIKKMSQAEVRQLSEELFRSRFTRNHFVNFAHDIRQGFDLDEITD